MTTPPRVARVEVDTAVARIADRHRGIDDERFANVDLDKPADVLDYLQKYGRGAPLHRRDVARKDVRDGLVIQVWLWWEDRRREYALLTLGVDLGITYSQLGAPFGLGSGVRSPEGNRVRGTKDRIERLAALLKYDRPDATITHEARRVARERAGKSDLELAWLTKHETAVATVAARLLAYAELGSNDAADYLVEVRRDWEDGDWTPESLPWMGLAAAALRVSPRVLEAGPTHGVHRAIKAVEALRSAFAGLVELGTDADNS